MIVFRSKPVLFLGTRCDFEGNGARKTWSCSKCNEEFRTVRLRRKHRKEAHPKETCHSYKYQKKGGSYFCKICEAEAGSEGEIERHVVTHQQSFDCNICRETFGSAYKFSCHMRRHGGGDTFYCPLCDYKTVRISSILQHINRSHLKKYLYNCGHCGKGFDDIVFFKEHENLHAGGGGFVCVVCEKEYAFSRYLLAHQLRYHTATIAGAVLGNQCPFCKKLFSKSVSLRNHVEKQHVTDAAKAPKEKTHLCHYCGKGFSTKTKLNVHTRVHTGVKPYACDYCDKCFSKKDYLVIHERTHTGERPYSCEHCGKCFNQTAPLRIHVRTHTGERPYVCHICTAGFTSRAGLNVHFKTCKG